MKFLQLFLLALTSFFWLNSCNSTQENNNTKSLDEMIVRISEIEIYPEYLTEYLAILKEEAAASVEKESGVISIFPMFQKEDSTQIRILEIYAHQKAYESHLETPHFKHYKNTTLKMVKNLKLVDMKALDTETMNQIFKK